MIEKIISDIMANPYEFIFWTALFYAGYHYSLKVFCSGGWRGRTNNPGPKC
tara:strand:- start:161 stop:313 length:153 start_codon:yes stop_codon:yes gene_type:complete